MPLPQIHRSDILAFYTKLLKHGFAINSLESINTIVHPTLEMAVDDDYIRKNPSKGIYRKLKTDGSAPKPKRRIALTKTQQQNFLRFIAKSPTYSHWLPIMTVLLGTGMRVAECTGITKSDINLSENTISVNHNLIYRVIDGKAGFHITTPKTESGTRIIPILFQRWPSSFASRLKHRRIVSRRSTGVRRSSRFCFPQPNRLIHERPQYQSGD